MLTLILAFVGLMLASAICSMSEAAILSVPFIRARILCEQKRPYAPDLLYIKENLPMAISSLVVINNIVNISGSILVGELIAGYFGDAWIGVISAILTFGIIVVGEIIPKTIGEHYKVRISLLVARPLRWGMVVLGPIVKMLLRLTDFVGKTSTYPRVTEDEIRILLKMGRDAGTILVDEEVLCNRVFKLNDVRCQQIMKPISQAYALEANATLRDSREVILSSPFSRIVVYEETPLKIVGVAQNRALLKEIAKDNYDAKVKRFMKRPIFVASTTAADTLLALFQRYHQHLFIVKDPQGQIVGLVSMEDVLEELFGEIYDEKDMETHALRSPDLTA